MACCKGSATWFCCYPNTCGCDACCCSGSNCANGCGATGTCGKGACCTCNSADWGYAWRTTSFSCGVPCGMSLGCGAEAYFPNAACDIWRLGRRVDSGPACATGNMVDLTRSFFMEFAPLSQGVISNQRVITGTSDCC